MSVDQAVATRRRGGVIAYPTEGVFGLGCLPGERQAVERILAIKQRDPAKGLILIAAEAAHFSDWIELPEGSTLPAPQASQAITWIVPASARVPALLRGDNDGIAVRITNHPVAHAICKSARSPIVSTSANLSGEPVVENFSALQQTFGDLVDYIVPGECGAASGPSEIRVLASGEILRAAED